MANQGVMMKNVSMLSLNNKVTNCVHWLGAGLWSRFGGTGFNIGQLVSLFVIGIICSPEAGAVTSAKTAVHNSTKFIDMIPGILQVAAVIGGISATLWGIYALTWGKNKRDIQEKGSMIPALSVVGGALMAIIVYVMGSVNTMVFGGGANMHTSNFNNGFHG